MPQTRLRPLTDLAARAAIPRANQYVLWDSAIRRFGLRISYAGTKSWIVIVGTRRITLGAFPILSLQEARAEAKRVLAEATLGKLKPRSVDYVEAREIFLKTHQVRSATLVEYRYFLTKKFRFEGRRLDAIGPRDVARVLDTLADTPTTARQAFAAAHVFFRWCVSRTYIDRSPCEPLRAPKRPQSRERVLTPDELRLVGHTATTTGPFGTIVILCMLMGQRRGEIAQLHWTWIDEVERTITLPSSVTKNKHSHTFPYGDMAAEVLAAIARTGDLLFPARGHSDKAFCGWSKSKEAFDKACPIQPWTLHDLRRTYSTIQAQLGTPPHITERLLNHVTGSLSPIALVYNRYSFMPEMCEAVRRYEQHVDKITTPRRDETVTLLKRTLSAA